MSEKRPPTPIRPDVSVAPDQVTNPGLLLDRKTARKLSGRDYLKRSFIPATGQDQTPYYEIGGIKSALFGQLMSPVFEGIHPPGNDSERVTTGWEERIYIAHRACEEYRRSVEALLGPDAFNDQEAADAMISLAHTLVFSSDEITRRRWKIAIAEIDQKTK